LWHALAGVIEGRSHIGKSDNWGVDPLVEDLLHALFATSVLGVGIAVVYWWLTGISPWPFVVLGEISGLGFGVAMLALCSPRRRRP
jgi:hypothetical protein